LIVGTHADKLPKQARASVHAQMQQLYPISNSRRNQIFGHFTLSITPGSSIYIFILVYFIYFSPHLFKSYLFLCDVTILYHRRKGRALRASNKNARSCTQSP